MKYHNNPLNIRYNPRNIWKGQYFPKDGFCQFDSLYYGFRAAFLLIKRYNYFGVKTVKGIINRWAPPSENEIDSYISFVCKCMSQRMQKNVDANYEIKTSEDVVNLLFVMSRFETGEINFEWKSIINQVLFDENFVQFK